jgi:hypothetical protein
LVWYIKCVRLLNRQLELLLMQGSIAFLRMKRISNWSLMNYLLEGEIFTEQSGWKHSSFRCKRTLVEEGRALRHGWRNHSVKLYLVLKVMERMLKVKGRREVNEVVEDLIDS